MAKQKTAYVVTHSYAADSDPAKVQATLDLWKQALAESVLSGSRLQVPLARVRLSGSDRSAPRRGAKKKVFGK